MMLFCYLIHKQWCMHLKNAIIPLHQGRNYMWTTTNSDASGLGKDIHWGPLYWGKESAVYACYFMLPNFYFSKGGRVRYDTDTTTPPLQSRMAILSWENGWVQRERKSQASFSTMPQLRMGAWKTRSRAPWEEFCLERASFSPHPSQSTVIPKNNHSEWSRTIRNNAGRSIKICSLRGKSPKVMDPCPSAR